MSEESSKHPVAQTENGVATKKAGKRHTCMRHCKRFWWIYLIAFICIVVLVVCLIIFVAVPKIAQDKVNDAVLEMQGTSMLSTESDNYQVGLNTTLTTGGDLKANVDGFDGVMYLEDTPDQTPFIHLHYPKTNGDKHQKVNISQHIDIGDDMDAFIEFNTWFHNNETLRITVSGRTKLKPGGLTRKYGVDFKKTVTVNGLNMFKGTNVTEGHISFLPDDEGKNFHGVADIPNASLFTLDIGNVSFANYIDDERVGSLYMQNVLLVPGNNIINITGDFDQGKILDYLQDDKYCKTGVIPFKLLGENVTNHGQSLEYFAKALGSRNQTVEIDIGTIIKKDLNTTIDCDSK